MDPSTSSNKGKKRLEIVTEVTMGDLSAFDELTPRPNKLTFDIDTLTAALPAVTHTGPSAPAGTSSKAAELAQALKNLPVRLQRPPKTDISPEALAAVNPDLAQVPLDLVLAVVREKGPGYLQTLSTARVELVQLAPGERIAHIVDVTLRNTTDAVAPPTHVLAVVEQEAERLRLEGRAKPTIRLIPVYNIVLASQCAKLPPLPPALQQDVTSGPRRVRLPVCRLVIPDLQAFPVLLSYLYSHSVANVLRALLPLTQDALPALATPRVFNLSSTPVSARVAPTGGSFRSASTPAPALPSTSAAPPTFNRFALPSLARSAGKAGVPELCSRVRTLHGLWSDAVALGVNDGALWAALDLSWDILLGGIASAVAEEAGQAPRPPPPRPIKGSRRIAGRRTASASTQASRSVSGSTSASSPPNVQPAPSQQISPPTSSPAHSAHTSSPPSTSGPPSLPQQSSPPMFSPTGSSLPPLTTQREDSPEL